MSPKRLKKWCFEIAGCWIGLFLLLLGVGCGRAHSDLYKQTDYFVEQLDTTYRTYGLQGVTEKRFTEDGKYGVFPMGRLVNVRIEQYADDGEYEKMRKALERHYKGDRRVNKVYRNQGGTITIDCRE